MFKPGDRVILNLLEGDSHASLNGHFATALDQDAKLELERAQKTYDELKRIIDSDGQPQD
jgi:hypothetical protein